MKLFIVTFALAAFAIGTNAAPGIGIEGKCPNVPYVENFNSEKFMGKWYGIKQTGAKDIPCITFQVEQPRPDHFEAFMGPVNATLEFDKIKADNFAEGLTVTFKTNPFMDGGNARIFATDYENYAGLLICKQGEKNYYLSLFFWSRTNTMSADTTALVNGFIEKYSLDATNFVDVKQQDCGVAVAV